MSDGEPPGADESDGNRSGRWADPPRLKDVPGGADESAVVDRLSGRPRLNWDAVTDAGGTRNEVDRGAPSRPNADRSSFQFDLGGALARLAGDGRAPESAPTSTPPNDQEPSSLEAFPPVAEPFVDRAAEPFVAPPSPRPPSPSSLTRRIEPMTHEPVMREPSPPPATPFPSFEEPTPPQDYPRRVPGTHFEPRAQPVPEPVPEIREATPSDAIPQPVARSSVFDDFPAGGVPSTAPSLPNAPPGTSPAIVPVLPAANPMAPPPVVAPVSNAPSTPEINALRSAQLRAGKQQRRGRMFGRSLLAFVVIGGLIAAALVFGRSILFDTSWDAQLTPVVNEIEAARGAEFDRTVPLETLAESDFGARLRTMTIGDAWGDRVPEWRALGLATGVVTIDTVDVTLAQTASAVYDAESDTIYLRAGVAETEARADLRTALEQAFDQQARTSAEADTEGDAGDTDADDANPVDGEGAVAGADGFTGVSALSEIAARAVDAALRTGPEGLDLPLGTESLPIPIGYELAAVDLLGEPIIVAAGVNPDTLPPDSPYPDVIVSALDDSPVLAADGVMREGDVALGPPVALGTDDWSLVWRTRLPEPSVTTMIQHVSADSYLAVDRNGTTCFVGVFDTRDEASHGALFAALQSWVASAPAASQAAVVSLDATRLQLEACDPGAERGLAPNPGVVASLIERQRQRLAP
jgi:hypothetical protein